MDKIVLKNGYIDACDLNKVNKSTKKLILESWIYKKNKHTQKEYYVKPPPACLNDNPQQNMRFNLLKIACEYQPETFAERLMREQNNG